MGGTEVRVLQVQGLVGGGGSERHTFILSRALRELGHEVVICVPDDADEMVDAMRDDRFAVEVFHNVPTWRRVVNYHGGRFIRDVVLRHDIDLVHTHLFNADVIGSVGARLAGRPVVTTFHGAILGPHLPRDLKIRTFMRLMRPIYRGMDARIAISPFVRDYNVKDVGLHPESIEVVFNASEVDLYDRDWDGRQFRREQGIEDLVPVVLMVGVLNDQKRPDQFLEMAIRVAAAEPDVHFVVAGHGPLRDRLAARAREAGISDRFHLLGHRTDIPRILAASNILVVTAREEGFGRGMTEAMASRIPVVAFDSGACADVVDHGVTGFISPDRDIDSLSGRVLDLIRDPLLATRMGEAGLKRVRDHFDVRDFGRKTAAVLDRVCATYGRQRE